MLHSSLLKQFRTNDRNLHYLCMAHSVFSIQCLPVQCPEGATDVHKYMPQTFGWARAFPMASRSEAHDTLLFLFTRDGVPLAYICNNAKKMIQGKLYQKLKDAACLLKQLEPYTPLSNAAEKENNDLKKEASHKLLRLRASKHFQDDCLELEAYIRSNTGHEMYKLDGEVPNAVMSDGTSDMSQFWKQDLFEWVMV